MKELVHSLREALLSGNKVGAESTISAGMDQDPNSFVQALRDKGILRTARYGFRSEPVAPLAELALHRGGSALTVQSQAYLQSVLALAELAPAVAAQLKKVQEFVNPRLLKTFLVTIDAVFRRGHEKAMAERLSFWRNYYKEELADAFSYYVALLREKGAPTVPDLNYVVGPRVGSEFYVNRLGALAGIVRFREAEIRIDSFPYVAIESGLETHIRAGIPEFEKSVRWGYISAHEQRRADELRWSRQAIGSINELAKVFVEKRGDHFFEILDGPYARIRVHLPLVQEFVDAFAGETTFREDHFLLQDAAKTLFVSYSQLRTTRIRKSITLLDLIKFRRLCLFIQSAFDEFCRRKKLVDTVPYFRSLACHFTEQEAFEFARTLCGVERPEQLFEVLCAPAESTTVFDILYTPVFKAAGQYLIPMALAANSNTIRNALQTSQFRFDSESHIDPLGDQIVSAFTEVGVRALPEVCYNYSGKKGEIDILVLFEGRLFAFECKNSLHPCNIYELRQSYGYLHKALDQLDRFRSLFSEASFRKYLANKTGLGLLTATGPTTCVVMGNRMFNGYRERGHAVRDLHELVNFITGGSATFSFPRDIAQPEGPRLNMRIRSWQGNTLSASDLVNYIEHDCWRSPGFEAMAEYDELIPFGRRSLRFRSFIWDPSVCAEFLRKHPQAEEGPAEHDTFPGPTIESPTTAI